MSGLRWTAGGKFLGQLVTWSITIVVIRLLSPSDYGLMSLTSVFVGFLAMLSELGLGAAVVQHKNLTKDTLRSLFGMLLIVSVIFYLSLVFAAPFIAGFYEEPRLIFLIQVLALQFLLMGFTVLPQSLLLRDMAFKKIATIEFISAIAGSAITLVLAFYGLGVWALVCGTLIIRIVSMTGLNIAQPFLHLPCLKMKGMGEFFFFGGYVTLSRMLWYFYISADILIIGKLLGKDLLGYYAVGVYLASLPMEKISGLINQVAFPAFSSVRSDPGLPGRHFIKAVRVMSFMAFPILWGISSISSEIIDIFLGSKWNDASMPLQIVALIVPVRMVSNLMNPTVLGLGRPEVSFLNSLVAFILMPGAFAIGSFWGLIGVSLAWLFAFPIVFAWNLSRVVKVLDINFSDVVGAMQMPIISALFMYCCLQLLRSSNLLFISPIPMLVLFITCGVIIYLCLTLLINRKGLQEVRELAKW